MKQIFATISLLLAGYGTLLAQNEEDVMRFSMQTISGSARSLAIGGAIGAVGSDITSASVNPAGLAQFRSNQFSFSLGHYSNRVSSTYLNNTTDATKGNLTIPSFGIVFAHINTRKGKEVKEGIINYSFALNFNRINSLGRNFNFNGVNHSSSITDHFAERAYGRQTTDLTNSSPEGLAYNTFLIDPNPNDPNDYDPYLPDSVSVLQENRNTNTGRMNELNLAMGFNYAHKIYFGFGVAINSLYFTNNSVFTETTVSSNVNPPRSLKYEYDYSNSGKSVSAKVGVIIRPNDYIRIGGSFQTRSRYRVTDNYYWSMSSTSYSADYATVQERTPNSYYEYYLYTPGRLTGSLALLLPKRGFISFDIEQVNYQKGSLFANDYSFSAENNNIKTLYTAATNYRVGAEYVIGEMRLRAGYALYSQAIRSELTAGENLNTHYLTGGLGYRNENGLFADLAVVNKRGKDFYTPYTLSNSNRSYYSALNQNNALQVVLTVGSNF